MASTIYEKIEDAIKTALTVVTPPATTPFNTATVRTYGAQLTDAEIAEELVSLAAPGVMVFYDGGETDGRMHDGLTEKAVFTLLVKAGGRTPEASVRGDSAGYGIYDLLDFCRGKLHGLTNANTLNSLIWLRQRRFRIPNTSVTVAAFAVDLVVDVIHAT